MIVCEDTNDGGNQYYIHQYGHGKNGPLSFSNCRIGIYTDKMMAYLYDNHMNPVNVGVEVKESIYSEVFFNKIYAFSSQTLQARGVNLTANIPLSAASIKVYGNDLIIGPGTTSAGVYVNGAIGNPYSAIIGNQPAGNGNTITMNGARYGIFGLTSNLLTTVNNTIDMNFGYSNSACFGIYLQRCPRSQHAFNTITGFGTPSVTNNINGFYATDCPEGLYFCNHTDNLMRGFWYNTSCQNSWLMGNDIGSAEIGLYLTNTAVIGPQFNGTDYNGNLWTGNYTLFGALTLNPISQVNSPFKVEQGGNPQNLPSYNLANWFVPDLGNDFEDCERFNQLTLDEGTSTLDELIAAGLDLTEEFVDEVKYIAKSNLYRKLLEDNSLINSSAVINQFYDDYEQSPMAYFENIEFNLSNISQLSVTNDSLIGVVSQNMELLFNQIHDWENMLIDSTLSSLDSLDIIQQIDNALRNVEESNAFIDSLNILTLQLRQNELNLIEMQNGNIQVAELYDVNRQVVNAIKLNTIYRGNYEFTQGQTDTLYSIASQCAILGGPGVYTARSLYALIDGTAFDDYALCIPYGFERQIANETVKTNAVKVIPNPATGQVLYNFNADVDGHISINLINSLGITVRTLQASIKAGQNSIPINYEDIAPGIYRYQLSGALTTSGKLVIIR